MVTRYEDFEINLIKTMKFRAKNFVVTDCDFDNIVKDIYDDIMSNININWVTQEVVFEKDVYSYITPMDNSSEILDTETEDISYYGESFDIVGENFEDISNFITEPEAGIIIVDQEFLDRNIGSSIFILRTSIVPIEKQHPKILTAIRAAMVEGLMYMIQDAIPSQVDGQLGNLGYQRFFAAKEQLKKVTSNN